MGWSGYNKPGNDHRYLSIYVLLLGVGGGEMARWRRVSKVPPDLDSTVRGRFHQYRKTNKLLNTVLAK